MRQVSLDSRVIQLQGRAENNSDWIRNANSSFPVVATTGLDLLVENKLENNYVYGNYTRLVNKPRFELTPTGKNDSLQVVDVGKPDVNAIYGFATLALLTTKEYGRLPENAADMDFLPVETRFKNTPWPFRNRRRYRGETGSIESLLQKVKGEQVLVEQKYKNIVKSMFEPVIDDKWELQDGSVDEELAGSDEYDWAIDIVYSGCTIQTLNEETESTIRIASPLFKSSQVAITNPWALLESKTKLGGKQKKEIYSDLLNHAPLLKQQGFEDIFEETTAGAPIPDYNTPESRLRAAYRKVRTEGYM